MWPGGNQLGIRRSNHTPLGKHDMMSRAYMIHFGHLSHSCILKDRKTVLPPREVHVLLTSTTVLATCNLLLIRSHITQKSIRDWAVKAMIDIRDLRSIIEARCPSSHIRGPSPILLTFGVCISETTRHAEIDYQIASEFLWITRISKHQYQSFEKAKYPKSIEENSQVRKFRIWIAGRNWRWPPAENFRLLYRPNSEVLLYS